jgi:hypothetical protein
LSRAQVRLKILAPLQTLFPQSFRTIQTRPADAIQPLLSNADPGLRGYARFELASLLWHGEDQAGARKVLEGNLAECGPLYDECEFLLAKIVEPSDSGKALEELTARLPDGHYLLDDVYWHRITTALDQHKKFLGLRLLQEVRRRCPNTDRAFSFRELENELMGKEGNASRDEQ